MPKIKTIKQVNYVTVEALKRQLKAQELKFKLLKAQYESKKYEQVATTGSNYSLQTDAIGHIRNGMTLLQVTNHPTDYLFII